MTELQTRPAAFFDRDGVLNVDHGYVYEIERIEWIKGAAEAVKLLNQSGFRIFVVTNQSGIARGLYDEAALHALHGQMQEVLNGQGAHIDAFYYCPHHPEGTISSFAIDCACRKPGTGMLEQAARDWPIDKSRSFMIGDREGDVQAAEAFGIHGIRFDWRKDDLFDTIRKTIASH